MTAIDRGAKRVLVERARRLAQPLLSPSAPADATDYLVFSRAGAKYAVQANMVAEVVPLGDPTPLVSVPAAVAGVLNHRGRIIAVIDVAALLPHQEGGQTDAGFAVVVEAGGARLALEADTLAGVEQVETRATRPAFERAGDGDAHVRVLTADMTSILDVEALARDPRVEVDDEVE